MAASHLRSNTPNFDRFDDDPVYQATVRLFEDRRAMLRERLPATLAEFGVEFLPVTAEIPESIDP